MKRILLTAAALLLGSTFVGAAEPTLEQAFARPPDEARPWVFWFWSDGNVTRQGITADLEAMKRVGIGGVAFMEVDQDVPKGPVRFMSPQWQEMFAFAVSEGKRLGLKFDLNNDAGWTGSGGPWIDGGHSMQKVVWTETTVSGPQHFEAPIAQPASVADFYRDIAVLAYPTPAKDAKIDKYVAKSGLGLIASPETVPGDSAATIDQKQLVDLTAKWQAGKLTWDVPAGHWTILRVGHTSTGKTNYPAVEEGKGLDVDKFSRTAFDRHYDAFVGSVLDFTGERAHGTTLTTNQGITALHIDSWEVGYQNWTAAFRDEMKRRRGYDPLPWLPAFAGHPVGDAALTERFLWDVRRTISELVNDNYGARMAERAHADGRVFTLEAYRNGPFDCLSFAGRADEPVGEFWMTRDPANLHPSVKTMTSAGHAYGKPVIGAEAFTATDSLGRQRNHPYTMKAIGDAAFCAGINQFIIHRYSMQPWVDDRKPGMTMGPWGVEYERTATWWEQTKPWHEYLSRCQYLLRQGRFVADFCYLQSEEGINNPLLPSQLKPALPLGYDFDFCSDEVVRTRMRVENGRIVLPDGMSYRMLVLPTQRLMRPELLQKIRDLVVAGAVVFGEPPLHSPSLAGYPACDAEVARLARELWGENPGARVDRAVGHGRVLFAPSLADVLPQLQSAPDFAWRVSQAAPSGVEEPVIRYVHRLLDDRDVYFVANLSAIPAHIVISLRTAGTPELWDAETGAIVPAEVYDRGEGRVRLPLELPPRGSIFVVVKRTADAVAASHLVSISRNGSVIAEAEPVSVTPVVPILTSVPTLANTFTIAAWVNPAADTSLPAAAKSGSAAYSVLRNDVLFPPPVHELLNDPQYAGAGFAVGRNGVTVLEHGDHHFPATLVYKGPIDGWTHVAIVFDRGTPHLYLNGTLVGTGMKSGLTVYSGVNVAHGREIEPFRGEHSALQQFGRALTASEIAELVRTTPRVAVKPSPNPTELAIFPAALLRSAGAQVWASEAGAYELKSSDGHVRACSIAPVAAPVAITGEWTLRFPAGWGAPAAINLPQLASWSDNAEPGVRYFSGTAVYTKTIAVPASMLGTGHRLWLELGDVRVIAEVKVNGRVAGTLWKPPFRVDVTDLVHAGANELEIAVTNLWVNRLIGDEQLPEDREWTKVPRRGGWALKAYPEWFQRGERSPVGRVTFATWKHYEKSSPLLPSGLLGPVSLRMEAAVPIAALSAGTQ